MNDRRRACSARRAGRGAVGLQGKHRIISALAAQDPGNAGWQRDLSVSFNKIGDVQSAKGDLDGALKAYQDSLAIRRSSPRRTPATPSWQRDLSVSFEQDRRRAGRAGRSRGRAARPTRQGRAIREKLAAQDPGNAEWQRDLSVSFNKIGDVQSAKGDLDGALEGLPGEPRDREKLAARDPANAEWQRDLSVS